MGDSAAIVRNAIDRLGRISGCRLLAASSLYLTEPVDYREQPHFINAAVVLETELEPLEVLHALQSIENEFGRRREFPKGPRTLDLDMLIYEGYLSVSSELTLPHPEMHRRRFVLEPLAEIAPLLRHPVLNRSVRRLLELCPDRSMVRKVEPGG